MSPIDFGSVAAAEVKEAPGVRSATSPVGGSLNLARPWKFPAGRADPVACRRHERRSVQVPVEITLYRPDGSSYDKGSGVVRDLSYSGLRLGDVVLDRGRPLPMCFAIDLHPAVGSTAGHDIAGRVLRGFSRESPGFGIEFLFPDSGVERSLRGMRR